MCVKNTIAIKWICSSQYSRVEQWTITVYESVINAVNHQSGGMYFLDAPGGTGKTFLISLKHSWLRSKNKIALVLAYSGIAATLLPNGFRQFTQTKQALINSVFPNLSQQYKNHVWLSERAILAGKNKDVSDLNEEILKELPN